MTTFILLFLIFLAISIWGWKQPYSSGLGEVAAIMGPIFFIITLFVSTMPVLDKSVEKFDAISIKSSNEIIVQSPGLPTQIVTDIKFIDKPLVIVKDTDINIYKLNETVNFTVEIK